MLPLPIALCFCNRPPSCMYTVAETTPTGLCSPSTIYKSRLHCLSSPIYLLHIVTLTLTHVHSCCPSGNYCAYTSNQQAVGCCPSGSTCSGNLDGSNWYPTTTTWQQQSTWYPTTTTYWQPSTYITTAIPTTTVYGGIVVPGGVVTSYYTSNQGVTTEYLQTQAQTVVQGGGYCSTLYANGGNLPTTRAGSCGTILVVNEGVRSGAAVIRVVAVAAAVVLVMVGWG